MKTKQTYTTMDPISGKVMPLGQMEALSALEDGRTVVVYDKDGVRRVLKPSDIK